MCKDCKKEPYYITTAIAYASGKPHIGNTYEAVLADAIARFKRAEGYDVFFQTGTDEHGQKIEEKAEAAGVTPQEFVDRSNSGCSSCMKDTTFHAPLSIFICCYGKITIRIVNLPSLCCGHLSPSFHLFNYICLCFRQLRLSNCIYFLFFV